MKQEIILSLVLHIFIVFFAIVSSPFDVERRELGEVIHVSITSAAELPSSEPVPLEPVPIPQPIVEDMPEIPISDPVTKEAVEIKPKKEEKPKKTNQKKPPPQSSQPGEQVEITGTGAGSPFQGATIDNASFNYPYWFTQAFNKLSGNFRNPVAYDGTLVCTIYFQVIKSGRIIELKVVASSGMDAFDNACLEAVRRSTPFPPLPRQFTDEIIGITVPFTNR